MMRELPVQRITDTVKEMCVKANHELSEDMQKALAKAKAFETSPVGQSVLGQLEENLRIAKEEMIPICQDTG
ncbi:MAG: fumarate hydratase, partial [Lachnospiraceae bacterium]|nr:fumarate hydratase [Lachnospiraceae bacterium]